MEIAIFYLFFFLQKKLKVETWQFFKNRQIKSNEIFIKGLRANRQGVWLLAQIRTSLGM